MFTEIGYNALHNRLGFPLPTTLQHLQVTVRRAANPMDPFMIIYESLTHGGDANLTASAL